MNPTNKKFSRLLSAKFVPKAITNEIADATPIIDGGVQAKFASRFLDDAQGRHVALRRPGRRRNGTTHELPALPAAPVLPKTEIRTDAPACE
jgi:hypothetical protein